MKATIHDTKALRDLCLVLKKKRARGSSLAILSKTMIRTGTDCLEFIATDLEVTKILRLPATVEEEGAVVVDIMDLDKMAKNLKKVDGEITIESEENNWARLVHPKITTRMMGVHPDEFPNFPENSPIFDVKHYVIDADKILRAFDVCEHAISTDDSRENLTGLYLEDDIAVSTDGHRLRKAHVDGAHFPEDGAIVPKNAITLVLYAAKKYKPETIEYSIYDDYAVFCIGDHKITARLIAGEFPRFMDVLPKQGSGTSACVDRASFLQALDLLEPVLSSKTSNARATIDEDGLEMYASDPDSGEATAPVKTHTVDGERVRAGFNADYLTDALDSLEGDEFTISIIDTLSPCVITEDSRPDDFVIVMPQRL